jgi:hypothetical protein
VLSCKKDDDPDQIVIEIRDRTEQQLADMDSLQKYLKNHYYNKAEIDAAIPNVGINDIKIVKVGEDETAPDGYELLETAVGAPIDTTYADTDYQYYVLKINQGGGDSPTFADDIRVNYEGFTLNDVVFDYSVNPVDFDLATEIAVEGWRRVFPDFNTSESFTENSDGTVSYNNSGLGVMFLPSGLAYFSNASGSIAAYSPLIFKFELLQMAQNDHDNDGIPSYLEVQEDDPNNLAVNTDEDTYRDSNSGYILPRYNYIDADDDGDGVLTKNEITVRTVEDLDIEVVKGEPLDVDEVLLNYIGKNAEGKYVGTIIKLYDTNSNEIPDYLESDIKIDYSSL